jgi:hypothetical protein
MNERIKELADQATSYADTLDVADQKIYQKIRDREFAELIVKECAKVADIADENGCEWIGGNVLTHFGVEE